MTYKQSDHDKKFDRQMRLWGAHGQINLENTNICVLGSGALASETLKNLVLPNIGAFTLVDDVKVTDADLGNNFFVTDDDIGKNRAKVVQEWLNEMNPDVKGKFIDKNYTKMISESIKDFKNYSFIISTNLYGKNDLKLGKFCGDNNIPYLSLKINGFMGKMRIQIDELCVMESHPTNDRTDLCIYPDRLKYFKELEKYAKCYDINTNDIEKKAHLPCIALLIQKTEEYMKKNDGKLPTKYTEKDEFKDSLVKLGQSQNYEDAYKYASQSYLKPKIYPDVRNVLNNKKGKKLNEKSNDFWILVKSLNDFREKDNGGYLPVSINIPDMTMNTKSYVTLKKIYNAQYEADLKKITEYVKKNLLSVKRKEDSIKSEIIVRFVKNCRSLKLVNCKSMADEINNPDTDELADLFVDPMAAFPDDNENKDDDEPEPLKPMPVHWYLGFRALDLYYDKNGKLPGCNNDKLEDDTKALVDIQTSLMKELKIDDKDVIKECLQELTRFGGSQMHNIAAVLGGMAAGTVMKCILQQFFPFNDTYIFDGIGCSGTVFKI